MRSAGAWVLVVAVVLGCHEEGGGCHWPWERSNLLEGAQHGEACEASEECAGGLVCASDYTCAYATDPGAAGPGEPCVATEWCRLGLVCAADATCTEAGAPGTGGLGEACEDVADCQLGLSCVEDACHGLQLPLWLGGACPETETGAYRGLFELATTATEDFYRLPFPNDARVNADGTLDLSGHPRPGMLIPEIGDVVATVFDVLQEDFDGFGNNQAVYFRMSARIDYDALTRGHPHDGGTWGVVDLTPGETYGTQVAGAFRTSTARGAYICPNWFAIAPANGRSYLPGHTYAAYLGAGLASDEGTAPTQAPDFAAMLASSAPSEARLTRAWQAYAPLRQWITATSGLDAEDFAVATVFTVQDPVAPVRALREVVYEQPLPTARDWWQCGATGSGPHASDDTRGCAGASSLHHELQGILALPSFQAGTPPFKTVRDGGGIVYVDGVPLVQGSEDVHVTLTVPKGATMPAAGWPLVIYGHGTGGSYVSAVREGLAGPLSDITLDDDTRVRFATLTLDAPMHGPRRHEENWDEDWLAIDPGSYDPDVLYFNPLNPRSARDNALQAAADHFSLVRWAKAVLLTGSGSPTGADIRFDDDHLYYLGHSQGSTAGVAFVAHEPSIRAAVFSGAGGLLAESLVHKKAPYDLAAAIAIGLADPDIERFHPVLNLVQAGAERADGINHAPHVLHAPLDDEPARHVLHTYGLDDSYTPNATQTALVRALRVQQAPNGNTALEGVAQVALPTNTNLGPTTGVSVLYRAEGDADAHFVLFDREDTQRQVMQFFGTAVRDGAPTVVAP